MATPSQRKGALFERELAAHLNERLGIATAARAPLSGGGRIMAHAPGSDLLGLPRIHVEAKRTERLDVRSALRQAVAACAKTQSPDYPTVITRRNRESLDDSLVVMRLADWLQLYSAFRRHHGL